MTDFSAATVSIMRRASRGLGALTIAVLAGAAALPAPAAAQSSLPTGDLQFEITYRRVSNFIRPARGQKADKISVKFSLLGAERISVVFNQGSGNEQHILRFGKEIEYNKYGSKMVFEKQEPSGFRRIINAPQTIETLEVNVTDDNKCIATISCALRDGFDEHKLFSLQGKPLYAANIVADSIVCRVKPVKSTV